MKRRLALADRENPDSGEWEMLLVSPLRSADSKLLRGESEATALAGENAGIGPGIRIPLRMQESMGGGAASMVRA